MTGHGELLRVKNKSLEVESKKPAPAVTVDDIAAAIFILSLIHIFEKENTYV